MQDIIIYIYCFGEIDLELGQKECKWIWIYSIGCRCSFASVADMDMSFPYKRISIRD